MPQDKNYGLETMSIHTGCGPDPSTGARTIPIHQTTAYVFDDAEHGADLFALRKAGFVYSRLTNPTVGALEEKLAALDGGSGATCAASGHAAQLLVLTALMSPGDHVVNSCKLYGGSVNQFAQIFPDMFGWKNTTFNPQNADEARKAITPKTKAIFAESLSNPEGVVADIEGLAKVAAEAGIPLIIDNTMATPYLCKPLEHGANIVTYSTTKFLSGHGNAMGGAVVDGGNFDWLAYADKFPRLAKPNPNYNNIIFAETFGNMALAIHNHAVGLRDLGMNQQPFNAYLTFIGMETLALRMQKHCENALAVAQHLESHDKVAWVSYAGLKSSPHHANANKYMKGHGGAVFTFALKDGYEACKKFAEQSELFSQLANIGDTRSLVIHPASTTHSQLDSEGRAKAGAGDDVLRVSIGIETIDDLIADINATLAKA
jgi:O-acetylhomoserine (thiol)-lyase